MTKPKGSKRTLREVSEERDQFPRQETSPESLRHDCLLIAVVCDIRGFTDLTARVDDYFQSNLVLPNRLKRLVRAYSDFMLKTQLIAAKEILAPFRGSECLKNFALKSTGDGFLVAVEVASGVDHRMSADETKYPDHWKEISLRLALGLINLIGSAKVRQAGDTFGIETYKFLKHWGLDIGYSVPSDETDRPDFRVAGSMAMGIGSLANRNTRAQKSSPSEPTYDDAYGHPVNLAFRLCDLAARVNDDSNVVSPYFMLDRRVARLLMSIDEYVARLKSKTLTPFRFEKPVKGIEEQWCFAFEKVEN